MKKKKRKLSVVTENHASKKKKKKKKMKKKGKKREMISSRPYRSHRSILARKKGRVKCAEWKCVVSLSIFQGCCRHHWSY
jgi:hypothetical protein